MKLNKKLILKKRYIKKRIAAICLEYIWLNKIKKNKNKLVIIWTETIFYKKNKWESARIYK
jgi:hypothetical protein